jgi:hypothetical protein
VVLPSIAPHETAQLGAIVCCTTPGSLQVEVGGAYDTPDHLKTLKKQLCSVRMLPCHATPWLADSQALCNATQRMTH